MTSETREAEAAFTARAPSSGSQMRLRAAFLSSLNGLRRCAIHGCCCDRSLDLERSRPLAPKTGSDRLPAFCDQGMVPIRPVLVAEPDYGTVGWHASRSLRPPVRACRDIGMRFPLIRVDEIVSLAVCVPTRRAWRRSTRRKSD